MKILDQSGIFFVNITWNNSGCILLSCCKIIIKDSCLKKRRNLNFYKMVFNFVLVAIGLIIFRAPSLSDSWHYLISVITLDNGVHLGVLGSMITSNIWLYLFVIIILVLEWTTRDKEHPLQFATTGLFKLRFVRWSLYFLICIFLFFFTNPGAGQDFIYFQF